MGGRVRQYVAAIAACMGGFALGTCIGWSAPCVEILKKWPYAFSEFGTNVIAGAFPLGAFFGILMVPFVIDVIGRKWTMIAVCPPFVVGWLLILIAESNMYLYTGGRWLTGACGGLFCVAAPMYNAEIAEKEIRGTLGVFFQLLLVIGILLTFVSGFSQNLKLITTFCAMAPAIFPFIMCAIPESPMFYLKRNNEDKAREALQYFRGNDDINDEYSAMKAQAQTGQGQKLKLKELFTKPLLKAQGSAYFLMIAQQLCGINAVMFYANTIFDETGKDPLTQSSILGAVQVVACGIAALIIDKVGRKVLMLFSYGTMSLCLIVLGIYFYHVPKHDEFYEKMDFLPIVSMSCYIVAFSFGAGPITWSYLGEIFPTRVKGVLAPSAAALNWFLAFCVTVSFSTVKDHIGESALFFFFSGVCLFAVLFVIFCMIETKGKSLEEIQANFGGD